MTNEGTSSLASWLGKERCIPDTLFGTQKRKWGAWEITPERLPSRGDETCVSTTVLSPQEWERITVWVWSWSLWWEVSFEVWHHWKNPHKTKKEKKSISSWLGVHQRIRKWEALQLSAETGMGRIWSHSGREKEKKTQDFSKGLESATFVACLLPEEESCVKPVDPDRGPAHPEKLGLGKSQRL